MLKNSYLDCFGLSLVISVQFTLEMCFAPQNCQKISKTPYFSVQSYPRSLLSVSIGSQCTTFY